jgi:hypothetical protein
MLGPKQLETRGYSNSIEKALKRLPVSLKSSPHRSLSRWQATER